MKKMIYSFAVMLSALSLTACSSDNFAADPEKDWAGTTEFFTSTEEKGFATYYKPAIGRVGDPMPFYDQKAAHFKVLYLQDYEINDSYRYHPIWGVATNDGANYESIGEVLPVNASAEAQDAALGTGCCVYNESDGLYYIYYTGHNPRCKNTEAVMRATSPDFKTWTRDNAWMLKGDDYGFSSVDFRDPQIFKGDDGLWHMVIASNLKFAEFTSADLKSWKYESQFPMIWDRMCECPDIFKMGDWWYLVYSEAYKSTWSRKVKYMMAKSWDALKACFNDPGANWPKDGHEGVLDSRAFYAGKTASNGTNRYIWGWCPYRTGANIYEQNINVGTSEPNWGGALVCHKVIQHSDGTLTLGKVEAIDAKYNQAKDVALKAQRGVSQSGDSYALAGDAYALFGRLGAHNKLSFTVKTGSATDKFGISLVRGSESKKYYTMVVNPENENTRKVNFEEEGPEGKGFIEGIDGYPFSRPSDNTYNITLYTDNSVITMYINDVCAYTQRISGIAKNCWSINAYGGSITVSNLTVSEY
ncbi:glycoside hydrolase family 32 protein [Prevotella sp. KH2C16]|uniref:glycoside hydrolase family 32 protein n=1 Tax=Prevotella sp. KH2C16 TaxID=1855325 RepID=UPI0008E01F73|nr:glycoside hydrolase family 32 protein [Prevotella sp. KH2C16]SFG21057.1 beta-fructofuranosidase [Prevotella sp. KH2C16]